MEDCKNLRFLDKTDGDALQTKWQVNNPNAEINIGDYCKLSFKENNRVEHMWVCVTETEKNGEIKGTLDNDPFILENIKLGDEVIFKKTEIEDQLT